MVDQQAIQSAYSNGFTGNACVFDPQQEIDKRVDFLCREMTDTGQHALVLGISGGVDSTVGGRLAQLAVNKAREQGIDASF